MIGAVQALGATVEGTESELTVSGRIVPARGARVDCGLAGTVLRFVPPVAALSTETVTFDGDEQACARPIAPLLTALRGLGATIDGDGLPFRVHGGGSVSRRHRRDRRVGLVTVRFRADALGAAFIDGLTIVHTGESVPSAPHVAMTVSMLRDAGVDVDDAQANRWRVRPGPIAARHWSIEPDLSNAVPFLSAAVVSGGSVRVTGWPSVSTSRPTPSFPFWRKWVRLCAIRIRISRCRAPPRTAVSKPTCTTSANWPRGRGAGRAGLRDRCRSSPESHTCAGTKPTDSPP